MGRAGVHHDDAKRYTRLAQAGAGVFLLLCGVAALARFGVPQAPADPTPTTPGGTAQPGDQAEPERELNLAAVSEQLFSVSGLPPNWGATPEPTPTITPGEVTPPPVADTGADWQFLGAILEPTQRFALVAYNGRQRLLKEGVEIDGSRLVEVRPESIRLRTPMGERTIDKAPRNAPVVGSFVQPTVLTPQPAMLGGDPNAQEAQRREKLRQDYLERRKRWAEQNRAQGVDVGDFPPDASPQTDPFQPQGEEQER